MNMEKELKDKRPVTEELKLLEVGGKRGGHWEIVREAVK